MGCVTQPNATTVSANPLRCPKCSAFVSRQNARTHVCAKKETKQPTHNQILENDRPVLFPVFGPLPSPFDMNLYGPQVKQLANDKIEVKVPANIERTHFKWVKQQTYVYPPALRNLPRQVVRRRTFQQKMMWFRLKIQQMRISWEHGCEVINVNRGNILMSCYQQLRSVNFHKQVKIKFADETVEDAGGLLREYTHLTMKELFSVETGIFQLCDTEQTAYKIRWDRQIFQELALQYMWILGVLVGKSIFDRISIDCRLNRTILRQICLQPIHINDVYSFDRKLYAGWRNILQSNSVENLFLMFAELKIHDDGTKEEIELIPNGKNVEVTDDNKRQYVTELINLYCVKSINKYLNQLKLGISYVVPLQLLSIFQPHELQMLMSGPSTIDLDDLIENTVYNGFSANDEIIQAFWAIIREYDQKKLANLLHYCTGSTRVPILGFKYLESNRNMVAKFTIQKAQYNEHNPYPKGHTCFNRLQLPAYESFQEMEHCLDTVLKQQMTHFGLD